MYWVAGGSVAGGSVAGGSVAGGSVAGGSVAGGSVAGGSVAESSVTDNVKKAAINVVAKCNTELSEEEQLAIFHLEKFWGRRHRTLCVSNSI
ncbi:predicted protein [Sclerotinia sclerotiorum 1980 UF-70]|uniref:Uncharacterized protein n=1 Tax=Sclerotinia sclerotiorum (strain ATCC 18683 / 1980 / Ss-1) TaxID=665079 RepID=A7EFV6_SCLS1|nr:predicted protein [Sclerotinia sclerotiorum 1980 UF-70]EDO01722.1 predicted protein [Sclerotinia sclerotiorum 1980 UF-70]